MNKLLTGVTFAYEIYEKLSRLFQRLSIYTAGLLNECACILRFQMY